MSDAEIRHLETIYRTSPTDYSAGARWVAAKLRNNLIPFNYVDIASRLGHPVAQILLPQETQFPGLVDGPYSEITKSYFRKLVITNYFLKLLPL